jgi:hypothetical protein
MVDLGERAGQFKFLIHCRWPDQVQPYRGCEDKALVIARYLGPGGQGRAGQGLARG